MLVAEVKLKAQQWTGRLSLKDRWDETTLIKTALWSDTQISSTATLSGIKPGQMYDLSCMLALSQPG